MIIVVILILAIVGVGVYFYLPQIKTYFKIESFLSLAPFKALDEKEDHSEFLNDEIVEKDAREIIMGDSSVAAFNADDGCFSEFPHQEEPTADISQYMSNKNDKLFNQSAEPVVPYEASMF